MPKSLSFRSGLGSILFWSVISAAFIGPGSVTACAMAGAQFGLSLLWVLTFATLGTVWLQEAAARITIATGRDLGQTIALANKERGKAIPVALFCAVALGCAAYQAGNILGAVSGLVLLTGWPMRWVTVGLGAVCLVLLAIGSTRWIANFLGLIVFAMGGAFVYVAYGATPPAVELTKALVVPSYPAGSLLLINGLIGTTIVPYNLFFGSGISQGQSLAEMRLGIWVAVVLGGIISVALLIAGLLVTGDFSYVHIADVMRDRVGAWGGWLFAFGWFSFLVDRPAGRCRHRPGAAGLVGRVVGVPGRLAGRDGCGAGVWPVGLQPDHHYCAGSGHQRHSATRGDDFSFSGRE